MKTEKKFNDDDKLMKKLLEAPYDDEGELNEQTIKDIKKAREDFKKGKYRSLSDVMKDYGL